MVFSGIDGITGVVLSDHGDGHGQAALPHTTGDKEISDLQDLYRRTLVASWRSPARDPDADKLIEDLFSAGWTNETSDARLRETNEGTEGHTRATSSSLHRASSGKNSLHAIPRLTSRSERRPRNSSVSQQAEFLGKEIDANMNPSLGPPWKPGSMEQKLEAASAASTGNARPSPEVSEFDVRDNLRSWEITPRE